MSITVTPFLNLWVRYQSTLAKFFFVVLCILSRAIIIWIGLVRVFCRNNYAGICLLVRCMTGWTPGTAYAVSFKLNNVLPTLLLLLLFGLYAPLQFQSKLDLENLWQYDWLYIFLLQMPSGVNASTTGEQKPPSDTGFLSGIFWCHPLQYYIFDPKLFGSSSFPD